MQGVGGRTLEAVACVLTVQTGVYPPTVAYETPDPECNVDLVANRAEKGASDIVLNNALAFGGYDAVVAFAKPGRLPDPQQAELAYRASQRTAAAAVSGGASS